MNAKLAKRLRRQARELTKESSGHAAARSGTIDKRRHRTIVVNTGHRKVYRDLKKGAA